MGKKPQRNPEKVNSLVYKDYTLVEQEDGRKLYVSPEEKAKMVLEEKIKSAKLFTENEKTPARDSDSDSGYEIPVERIKPKSCDDLDKTPKPEMKRNSSLPFAWGEWSPGDPGDNGRINLPPHIIPLETSLTLPITKEKRSGKKKKKRKSREIEGEVSSPEEGDDRRRYSLDYWRKKRSSETDESPEDAEVREITEGKEKLPNFDGAEKDGSDEQVRTGELEEPVEVFPEPLETTKRHSYGLRFPKFPNEPLKRKSRNTKVDRNPLKSMFKTGGAKGEPQGEEPEPESELRGDGSRGRYGDAALSHIPSDTESADHGSADKSSMSKLTSERQPKKLMSGLFGSFRKGRNKDKVADNDPARNPSSFEITVKEQPEETVQTEITRPDGIVYAELDMARSTPGSVMRRDDEKTEYAEIIYPGSKMAMERPLEELRKSRENLTSSRDNLTEVDEAYSVNSDGKKEAAV